MAVPPKPRPFAYARDIALLNLAVAVLRGCEVHILNKGTYVVLGDDKFCVVVLRGQTVRCISCKSADCSILVEWWRTRLLELGAQP